MVFARGAYWARRPALVARVWKDQEEVRGNWVEVA